MPFSLDPALVRLFVIFFGIAFLRNTIIYWVARIIAHQATKTIVNTVAGLTQMKYVWYLPALILGCTIHGIIYTTIGWAAWIGMLRVAAGSPWGISGLMVVGMGLATVVIMLARKLRRANQTPTADSRSNGFEI